MTAIDDGVDFDGWLRGQLWLTLGPERGPRPRPAQARYAAGYRAAASRGAAPRRRALRSGARALLAAGVAAALVAGGAAATAATGTANPVSWGRQVVQVVQQCQESRGTQAQGGSEGIGRCVSPTARNHGSSAPATTQGAAATTPNPTTPPGKRVGQQPGAQPAGSGSGNASSNGNGNAGSGDGGAHGHGQSQSEAPGAGHGAQSRPASSPKA